MSSLSLQQRQTQQLKLTPQQIQVIKLLELPACDLQQRINEELQENPALEEGRVNDNDNDNDNDNYNENEDENDNENDNENYDNYDNYDNYGNYNGDDNDDEVVPRSQIIENSLSLSLSLFDYLKQQIYLTKMTKPERHIAKWVIGNIDDDGFLRRTTEQLVDDLAFQEGEIVPDDAMKHIVEQIKQFDPPGVAAYDLHECLITQLRQRPQTPSVITAIEMLTRHFDAYSNHKYAKIQQSLNITEDELKAAINEILKLNQKPANAFGGNTAAESKQLSIIPDFVVENKDGDLVITLQDGDIPPLHVSADYQQMLTAYSDTDSSKSKREAARFIRTKIDDANLFIDAIRQRNETLSRTMRSIVAQQREFFLHGGEYNLRPMRMQDIADITGYDVSTISRVSNSKYVQTEYGVFPLKYFFNDATTNDEGETVTTREVKNILSEVIAAEDHTNPMNDDQLVDILQARGYTLARRTIAKYRDQLGIPVARLRKEL